MSTESDNIKLLSDLINSLKPSIVRSKTGLVVTQQGVSYEIPLESGGDISSVKLF